MNEYEDLVKEVAGQPLPEIAPQPQAPVSGGYDQFIEEYKAEKVPAITQSMWATSDVDPDREAKVQALARKTGLPKSVVGDNYEEVAKQYGVVKPHPEEIANKTPGLATWLENPDNAAIGQNELHNLGKVDAGISQINKQEPDYTSELGTAFQSGWNDLIASTYMSAAAYGVTDKESAADAIVAYKKRSQELNEKTPKYVESYNNIINEEWPQVQVGIDKFTKGLGQLREGEILEGLKNFYAGEFTTLGEFTDLITKIVTDYDAAKGAFYEASRNAANSIPSLGLSFSGGLVGSLAGPSGIRAGFSGGTFLGTALTEIGSSLIEKLEKKGIDLTDRKAVIEALSDESFITEAKRASERRGIAVGAVEGVFSLFAGKFTHGAFQRPGVANKAIGFGTDVAVESVGEGAGNLGGQVAEAKGDTSKLDYKEAFQDVVGSIFQSLGTTIGGTVKNVAVDKIKTAGDVPPTAPTGREKYSTDTAKATTEAVDDFKSAVKTVNELQIVSEVMDAVNEVETTTQVPGKIAELIEVSGGENNVILFQKDEFDKYWQEQGKSPSDAAAELIEDGGSEYNRASESKSEIQVPLGKFIENIAKTQHVSGLINIARASTGMTLNEAKEIADNLPNVMSKLAEEASQSETDEQKHKNRLISEYGNTIQKQFEMAGYAPKQAKAMAQIAKGNLLARSAIMEMPVEDLLGEKPLRIEAAEGVPGEALKQEDDYSKPRISKLGLYFKTEQAVTSMNFEKMPAQDLLNKITNTPGVKKNELNLLGLEDYLKARNEPVSKKEVVDFIRGNGFRLEQTVLGTMKKEPSRYSDTVPSVSDLRWSEERVLSYSQVDSYGELWNYEIYNLRNEREDWAEKVEEKKKELVEEYTDKDGNIDEKGLAQAADEAVEEQEYEIFVETIESGDSLYSILEVTEEATGIVLRHQYDDRWEIYDAGNTDIDTEETLASNLNESQVMLVNMLLENGDVVGDVSELVTPESIKIRNSIVPELPSKQTISKKAKALIKGNEARYEERARTKYPYRYDTDVSEEDIKENLKEDIAEIAMDDVQAQYSDPDDKRNTVSIDVSGPNITGRIVGNNVKGWKAEIEYNEKKYYSNLNGNTVELAKESVKKYILEDIIGRERSAPQNLNRPTGSAPFKRFTVPGEDASNYREFLVKSPVTGELTFTASHHGKSQVNVVGHLRVHDGTVMKDGKGSKVLFVDEIQSDWDRRVREYGAVTEKEVAEAGANVNALLAAREEPLNKLKELFLSVVKTEDSLDQFNDFRRILRTNGVEDAITYIGSENVSDEFKSTITEYKAAHDKYVEADRALLELQRKAPVNPYPNSDAVNSILLKQAVRIAIQEGYDGIAISNAETQVERWGTDSFTYEKYGPGYVVRREGGKVDFFKTEKEANDYASSSKGTVEKVDQAIGVNYYSSNGDGVDYDFVPNEEYSKEILDSDGKVVTNASELAKVLSGADYQGNAVGRAEKLFPAILASDKNIDSFFWRREGFKNNYDKNIPGSAAKTVLSQLDKSAKVTIANVEFDSGDSVDAHYIEITPKMRETFLAQGLTYFQENQGVIRGFFDPIRNLIGILKDKNLSTGLHELSHYFFKTMQEDVTLLQGKESLTPSQKDFLERSQTLLSELGINSWEEATVQHQELLADKFTAYLMQGKAPTTALRKAFSMFKQWLFKVFGSIEAVGGEINPEIKEVFDKLIAIDEEVDAAIERENLTPLFSDPRFAGMTEEQTKRYLTAQFEAKEAAKAVLNGKVNQEYRRKQETAYKEKRAQVKTGVVENVNKNRTYLAISALKVNKLPDGNSLPANTVQLKISKADFIAKFGKAALLKLPRGVYSATGGVDVDVVASSFGYNSGKEMVDDITNAIPYNDYVEKLTNIEMEQNYPEFLTIDEIPEEALTALHNEKRNQLLRMEIELLAKNDFTSLKNVTKALIRRAPSNKYVRDQANKTLSNTLIAKLKPSIFLRAEKKHATAAAKAWASGDINAALESKVAESLNAMLYQAALKKSEEYKKSLKDFKKFFKKDEDMAKSRNMDLVNAGRAVLAQLGVGETELSASEYLEKIKNYSPDTYLTLTNIIKASIPDGKTIDDLTVAEFEDVSNALYSLWDLSRSEKQLEIDGKKQELSDVVEGLVTTIEAYTNKPALDPRKSTDKSDLTMAGLFALSARLKRVEHWAIAMGGKFKSVLYDSVEEKTTKYRIEKIKAEKIFKDNLAVISDGLDSGPIEAPNLNFTFSSKAHLIGAMLHSGNMSNLTKLVVGYGWGKIDDSGQLDWSEWQRFLKYAESNGIIKKADWDFVQSVWDLLDGYKSQAQKAHKEMYGYYFNEVTKDPIKTEFGTYSGGYFPAKTDTLKVTDSESRNEMEFLEMNNNSFAFPTAGNGATKNRVDGYNQPLSLDLGLAMRHIDWVLRFSIIMPTVRNVAKIVWNRDFVNAMEKFQPGAVSEMLKPFLQRAVQQTTTTPSVSRGGRLIDKIASHVRSVSGSRVMFMSVSNAAQQFTGISAAALKTGAAAMKLSLWSYVKNPKTATQFAHDSSDFMKTRIGENSYEVNKEISDLMLNPNKYEITRDFLKKNAYILQSLTQGVVDVVVWNAAYNKAVSDGLLHGEAVKSGDSAVRTTQGSFNPEDVSASEVTNPSMRLVMMFYSYFNNLSNLLGSEFSKVQRDMGLKKGRERLFYVYLFGLAVPAILSEAIKRGFSGKIDDDDDDEYIDDLMDVLVGSQFRTVTAMVPFAGQTANYFMGQFDDKAFNDRISISPAAGLVESAFRFPVSVNKYFEEGTGGKRALIDSLSFIELVSGAPLSPIYRSGGYLLDVEEGKKEPTGAIDFTRGLITGK